MIVTSVSWLVEQEVRSGSPSNEWPNHAGKGEDGTKRAKEKWALLEPRSIGDNGEDRGKDTTRAATGNRSAKDLRRDRINDTG